MALNDPLQRSVLPIPDRRATTLTTYDAKDPDTKVRAETFARQKELGVIPAECELTPRAISKK